MKFIRIILSWKIDLFPDKIVDFYKLDFDRFVKDVKKYWENSRDFELLDLFESGLYIHDEWVKFNRFLLKWDITEELDGNPLSILKNDNSDYLIEEIGKMKNVEKEINIEVDKTRYEFFFYRNGIGILRGDWTLKVPDNFDYRLLENFDCSIGDYFEKKTERKDFGSKLSQAINKIIISLKMALAAQMADIDADEIHKVVDWDDLYIIRDPSIKGKEDITRFLSDYQILHGLKEEERENLFSMTENGHLVIGYDGAILFVLDDFFDKSKIETIAKLMDIAGSYVQSLFSTNVKLREWMGNKNNLFPNSIKDIEKNIAFMREYTHYVNLLLSDSSTEFIAMDKETNNILSASYRHWNYETIKGDIQKKSSIIADITRNMYSESISKKSDILNEIIFIFTILTFSAVIATLIQVIDFENYIFPLELRILLVFAGTLTLAVLTGIYVLSKIRVSNK
ncbi:MAG: hypothetical protein FE043_01985 [Thermoplasmata archaeon]|nr:MAG: hypothetical protein FE043_01985 [Thermoplasmata archaeon]